MCSKPAEDLWSTIAARLASSMLPQLPAMIVGLVKSARREVPGWFLLVMV
jgi:hypothetical protein